MKALEKKLQGEIEVAQANILVYTRNPAGIGEHPDVMAAIESEIDNIAKAHERIEVINHYFMNR